ncbi:hypothetical protein Q5O24_00985 [Eubacteriaceae bacterium ES3]|nr:hypothetical protein Q5O24_00985 [Eubacteriaceae bacterium ES3]
MKNPIKNEGGSALAYVLIFGVIIMVLVLGLMTVAQSGISFTQQSVESRQAYIDAKSVIEYGKIEISERGEWLETENNVLKGLYDQLSAAVEAGNSTTTIQASIDEQKQKIHNYMTAPYYIGGTAGEVISSLSESTDESSALGVMSVVEENDPDSTNVLNLNYVFDIQTQNLRRTLDYQTSLNYTQPVYNDDGGGTIQEPAFSCSDETALATQIKKSGSKLSCVIQKTGNEKAYELVDKTLTVSEPELSLAVGKDKDNPNAAKFDWISGNALNLTAKNICFTAPFPNDANDVYQAEFNVTATDTIRVKENYIQNNNDTSKTCTFEAQNIVFEGNVTLNNAANLEIKCKNLWIKGDINLVNGSGTNASLKIEAENIIIGDYENHTGGNINIGNASQIEVRKVDTYDCNNLWIRENVNLVSSGGTSTVLKVDSANVFVGDYKNNSAGKVTIGDKSQLDLNCSGNIMIRDDLELLTNSASPENNMTAQNIRIGTESNTVDLTVKNMTVVNWNCENFWLYGDISTTSTGAKINFNNINYLKTGDIYLRNGAEMNVTGAAGKGNNVMICGYLKPAEASSHTFKLNYTDLAYCIFDGLEMDQYSELHISSDFVGFKEVYKQSGSTSATINNANNVVFSGSNFELSGWSQFTLNISASNIYLDTSAVSIQKFNTRGFHYFGMDGTTGTNLYLKQPVAWDSMTVTSGKYSNVGGDFPQVTTTDPDNWLYNLSPTGYNSPSWTDLDNRVSTLVPTEPSAPNAGQSSGGSGTGSGGTVSTGFIANGSEKYY